MRRTAASGILLIQLCVQIIPLASAEDGPLLLENSTGSDLLPMDAPVALSGAILEVVESGSGVLSIGALPEPLPEPLPELPLPVHEQPLRVVITEVAWMGSDLSTADEWVELAAFASGSALLPQSVSGWTLFSVKAGVETVLARLSISSPMSSGGVLVIANARAASSRLANEAAVVTTAMSLPNTQLLLRLRDATGALMDEVDDGIGVPFAGANPSGGGPKAAMERVDPWRAGSLADTWKTATLSLGFDEGPPIFGTPGVLGSVMTPVPPPPDPSPTPGAPSLAVAPAVRLTEVLPNPPGADSDEWVEIGSFDPMPVDMAEMALRTGVVRYALSGMLAPGEHRRYGRLQSGLPLPNSSGTLELLWRDRVIDRWTYTETPEGISSGRLPDETVRPQCVPSPDRENTSAPLDPEIAVQSSNTTATKVTLNLEVRVVEGSLSGATCSWQYPDQYQSASCNPPSHTISGPLSGQVILTITDYCGTTMVRTLMIDSGGGLSSQQETVEPVLCRPSAFTGVVVSEVFPNPLGDESVGEWIELANVSGMERPLCGWSVDDGERGSAPYALDRYQLHPGDTLLLPRSETAIALNNDRDAVRLTAPLPLGGFGAYEIVRYDHTREDQSFARREDGVQLWTLPTPSAANVFRAPTWPATVPVRLVQAMPNPSGNDRDGGEWIAFKNQTRFPLPMTGWRLTTAASSTELESLILGPLEQKRIASPLTLSNSEGFLELQDREGTPLSLLAWENAKEGQSVTPPRPRAYRENLTFLGTEDCTTWQAQTASGARVAVHLSVRKSDNIHECTDFVSALLYNNKFDQELYSKDEEESGVFVGGVDVALLLLRHGLTTVDEQSRTPLQATYRIAEGRARAERLGVWANAEYGALLDEARFTASIRETMEREGLRISSSLPSGIIREGDTVELHTNVPAALEVAIGSGSYLPYTAPIMLHGDTELAVRAVSAMQTASGSLIESKSFQSYALLKSRYPHIRISEVYPSPAKGEKEWVELWNPSEKRLSLLGWLLDDVEAAGSKPSALLPGTFLEPGARLQIQVPTIAWNNTGDSVRLLAPNGRVSDAIEYGSVKTGRAIAMTFSRTGEKRGECLTIHPTPGLVNRCGEELPKSAIEKRSKAAKAALSHRVRWRNVVKIPPESRTMRQLFARLQNTPMPTYEVSIGEFIVFILGMFLCSALIVLSYSNYRLRHILE